MSIRCALRGGKIFAEEPVRRLDDGLEKLRENIRIALVQCTRLGVVDQAGERVCYGVRVFMDEYVARDEIRREFEDITILVVMSVWTFGNRYVQIDLDVL